MFDVPLDEATDIFYSSETANMIEDGIADLHCRSDRYLAGEVWREYQESKNVPAENNFERYLLKNAVFFAGKK